MAVAAEAARAKRLLQGAEAEVEHPGAAEDKCPEGASHAALGGCLKLFTSGFIDESCKNSCIFGA